SAHRSRPVFFSERLAAPSRPAHCSKQVLSSAFDLPYGSTNWTLVSTGKLLLRRIATAVNEPCWPFELQLSSSLVSSLPFHVSLRLADVNMRPVPQCPTSLPA